jgi:protoporphyrinogen oxidase
MEHEAHALFVDYPKPLIQKVIRWKRAFVRPRAGMRPAAGSIRVSVTDRIFLAGSYLQQRGLEGAVTSGREAAFQLMQQVERKPRK